MVRRLIEGEPPYPKFNPYEVQVLSHNFTYDTNTNEILLEDGVLLHIWYYEWVGVYDAAFYFTETTYYATLLPFYWWDE